MTPLTLAAALRAAARLLARLWRYGAEVLTGIEEARAMALRYQALAALPDRELARRGLKRADIPHAVVAPFRDR